MALGALIGAYQEDDQGGLRALLPLAGRTLIEYQARCAAAAGAAPIVVLVERVPPRSTTRSSGCAARGMTVVPVSDGNEAASRFEAGTLILLIADGFAPDCRSVRPARRRCRAGDRHCPRRRSAPAFERIDATSRWAGVALVDGQTLASTAAMLGDWDLQSTLLRRAVQAGARRVAGRARRAAAPCSPRRAEDLAGFERRLLVASRGARDDWASRYHAAAGRGIRHRAADGNAGPARMAGRAARWP